jgi:hypothetical protein
MTATAAAFSDSSPTAHQDTNGHAELPFQLPLELVIDDREIIRALMEHDEGEPRNRYATEAMKIGILALRHVSGQLSEERFRRDGDRFIATLQTTLDVHRKSVQEQIENRLKEYFDPNSGRFEERVQRLIAQDGDLSRLMRGLIDGENSVFAKTMLAHVGRDSALMKQLDPKQSDGLLAVLKQAVELELSQQREHILREFSLDNKESALSKLVKELSASNSEIVKELSLNEENSALNRLVQKVSHAQVTITNEFSLDNDTSCLSKLKKELMTVLEAHVEANAEFQEKVMLALRELTVRKAEHARTTEHGKTFQRLVCEFIQSELIASGDLVEFVGDGVGLIANCKKGDVLLKLGCDSNAPGAKIIVEAKDDKSYSVSKALEEIELARKNRGAQIGVFVFCTKTAPQKLRPISRYGNDILVVWDSEDSLTDSFLWAAVEFGRLACFRSQAVEETQASDFANIEKLIANVEKRAANLLKIHKYAETAQTSAKNIQSATAKIMKRAGIDKKALDRQISQLRKSVIDLKQIATPP